MNLTELGFTKEELQDRVIEKIADDLLTQWEPTEDGEHSGPSTLRKKLDAFILQRVNEAIAKIADEHILPNAATYLENFTIQATNHWGEKTGERVTFIEYLTKRADAYMRDEVDSSGKSKDEMGGSSFYTTKSTRLAWMIDKHLHYTIEASMKNAVGIIQGAIVPALSEVVKAKLDEISKGLTVAVGVKK